MSACRRRCREDSSGRPRGRRTSHSKSRPTRRDLGRSFADRGRRWPRRGSGRVSRAGCSFDTHPRRRFRNTHRPRTWRTRSRWWPSTTARACAGRRCRRSRHCRSGSRTGDRFRRNRFGGDRSSSGKRRWCRGTASSRRAVDRDRSLGHRKCGGCSPANPSMTRGRIRCFGDRVCKSRSHRRGR